MSDTILVACGQCGNQLGYSILDSLHTHLASGGDSVSSSNVELSGFFRYKGARSSELYARAVCFDTEPKVIDECYSRTKAAEHSYRWSYDGRGIAYSHGGAGNNWALGYEMYSGEYKEITLNCLRREIELCDSVPTLVIVHSVAGGTGSGLGTRVTETVGDEFGDLTKMNVAITPYHFGEVVVQHYNTLLCVAKISSSSDGIVVFENETAQGLCREMKGIDRPSLKDINELIAANVAPFLLPKYHCNQRTRSHIGADIVHLCSHPGYRFLDVKVTPQTSSRSVDFTYDSWHSLLSTVKRMQMKGISSERGSGPTLGCIRSIGSVLTLRGADAAAAAADTLLPDNRSAARTATSAQRSPGLRAGPQEPELEFSASYSHLMHEDPVAIAHSPHFTNGYQRSACLLSNSQSVLPVLQRAAAKASKLFLAGAYVHQYRASGVGNDDFVDAFREVGQIIENYKAL